MSVKTSRRYNTKCTVFFSFAIITEDKVVLFINANQVNPAAHEYLDNVVVIHPYESFLPYLKDCANELQTDKDNVRLVHLILFSFLITIHLTPSRKCGSESELLWQLLKLSAEIATSVPEHHLPTSKLSRTLLSLKDSGSHISGMVLHLQDISHGWKRS